MNSEERKMAYSSILGADIAPQQPSGRHADLLGPSDNSDSGSDTLGTHEAHADSDSTGTGERGSVMPGEEREGADILPDRVVRMEGADADEDLPADPSVSGDGFPAADPDARELTDLDAEPGDDERTAEE